MAAFDNDVPPGSTDRQSGEWILQNDALSPIILDDPNADNIRLHVKQNYFQIISAFVDVRLK